MSSKQQRERKSARARSQQQTSNTFANTLFKVPDGVSELYLKDEKTKRLEILPFKAGAMNEGADAGQWTYELTYYMHRNVGANEEKVICPRKMGKGRCPICEHRAELAKDPDADEELVKDLLPKKRQLFWVLDHAQKSEGAMIWDMSYHLFGRLLAERVSKDTQDEDPAGYEYFYDEVDGYTLRCGVTEQKMRYKFLEVTDIDFRARQRPIPQKFVDATSPLSDMLTILDYDTLYAKFHQTEVGNTTTHQGARPSEAKGNDKPTDDDGWGSDEKADTPAKEEKPKAKAKKASSKPAKAAKEEAPKDDEDWDSWGDDAEASSETSPLDDPPEGEYEDAEPPEAEEPKQAEPAASGDDDNWEDW